MTERKVLNKYFPPDFDPAKIPRLKGMKKEKVFSIRTMAPFNMMCLTCRGYIFKAKKFNSRMEECEFMYLDLKEYRFHIRCPTCCAEIVYRTDRENNDYVVESGAKRSFEAYTTAIRQAIKESIQEKEELEKNPIKALEKRTEESMNEFKMSNKIQDLMERSKNDPAREDMIDSTLEMLKRKQENQKAMLDEEIQEKVKQQIKEQQKMEAERTETERSSSLANIDFFANNSESARKINVLKRALQQRRQQDAQSDVKRVKIESEPSISDVQEAEVKTNVEPATSDVQEAEPPTSCNLLGLDYDSNDE